MNDRYRDAHAPQPPRFVPDGHPESLRFDAAALRKLHPEPSVTDAQVDAALAVFWLPQRFACWAESQKVAARPVMRAAIIAAIKAGGQ